MAADFTMLSAVPKGNLDAIVADHDGFLFDAFGVLNDARGALPGAVDLVQYLRSTRKPFFVITNGAAHTAAVRVATFQAMGLRFDIEQIISSGEVLGAYLAGNNLAGKSAVVLGPAGAQSYVTHAGLRVIPHSEARAADVIIVTDQSGFDFVAAVDDVLSALFMRIDEDPVATPLLLLANPDLYYPAGSGRVGMTSGLVASLLDSALRFRYGADAPAFVPLGKPHAPIFAEAARRAGTTNLVMFGDQVQTDIRGAIAFGMAAVLVGGGLTNLESKLPPSFARGDVPTWWIPDLVMHRSGR